MTIVSTAGGRVGAAATVESRRSWVIAATAVAVYAVSYGAPMITVVGLKTIATDLGGGREVPALAYSLAWLGAGIGGIAMGRLAERVGVRRVVMGGAVMIAVGLAICASGGATSLYVGQGVFMGLVGNACINAPLYIYVARWFDRRRGTALALISSGQYVAGAFWPPIFEHSIAGFGWRHTMLVYAVFEVVAILPLATLVFTAAPETVQPGAVAAGPRVGEPVIGMRANLVLGFLCLAGMLCCIPMAMPQGHLVAYCSDIGISASQGALMLSVLLGCAFISRQFWGVLSDRIGGLNTVLVGSVCQVTALIGFLLTQSEAGLFAVSAWFGLGFSGIIPAYVLAIRQLFPASEAAWRIPMILLFTGSGMAIGGWLAGAIFDRVGFYQAAFAAGIAINLLHIVVVGGLVVRQRLHAVA
ncbi:MAG TPA: MFS transporter [Stellaceae bacterium]|nr:MFS transporter [Stellaceae bacterium]